MRVAAAVLISITLAGCGTTASTKLDVKPASSVSFEFRDERPPDQRITSKSKASYGETTTLGDDGVNPVSPVLFKTWLEKAHSQALSGKTVVLSEFAVRILDPQVTIDDQRFARAAGSVPGANPLSALAARFFVGGIESARSAKNVSVRIGGKIGEQEFVARWAESYKGRVTEADVNSVIVQALDALVKEVNSLLNPPVNAPEAK